MRCYWLFKEVNLEMLSLKAIMIFWPSVRAQVGESKEKLQQIILSQMERIGFGDQLYLAYKHNKAAHMHVHIATINIKPDGNRIDFPGE